MSSERQYTPRAEAQLPLFVGVDLGGTNVKVGVVDDLGRTLSWLSIPTDSARGAEDTTARMGSAVCKAVAEAGANLADVAYVGLGSPGTMDIPAGMLLDPVNMPTWHDYPIRDRLSYQCRLPVAFANDAGAAAYGEFWIGSGREYQSLVLLTLGTGVGGGIIVDGFSIDGEHSHGAEVGHIIIDSHDDARVCGCGKRGHLEAYASATGVTKRTQDALATGRSTSLRTRLSAGEKLTPRLISTEAEAGDSFCTEIILETARYLGIGVVTLMHTIDPAAVILGGAMTFGGNDSPLGRQFIERVREEVRRRAFPVPAAKTRIEFATLGADAGYIGAAGIGRLAYRKANGLA